MAKKRPFGRIAPQLDDTFQAGGFQRLKPGESKLVASGTPAWRQLREDTQYVCDLQPWKWGYDPWFGSSFTVNFFRWPGDFEKTFERGRSFQTRILPLTDVEDRVEIARLQNAVINKCHVPTPEEFKQVNGLPVLQSQLGRYQKRLAPITPARLEREDVWLAFLDDADVDSWCGFLKSWLPKGLARFLSINDLTGYGFRDKLLARWKQI
jgi:hypothetical protein